VDAGGRRPELTSASPSFLTARDAILQALDDLRSTNRLAATMHASVRRACWQAFARFGMGFRASSAGAGLDRIVGDETLPPGV